MCCWVSRVVASSEAAELIETLRWTTLLVVVVMGTESVILMAESESESLSEETTITSGGEGRNEGELNSVEAVDFPITMVRHSDVDWTSGI